MGTAGNLAQQEAADALGISVRQVQRLGKKGIPRNPDGTYPFPKAAKWYADFKRREGARRARGGDTTTYEKARAARMAEAARKLALENAVTEGRLISTEVYRRRLIESFSRVAGRLDALPGSWAPRLAACSSVDECQILLRSLVRELKEELLKDADDLELEALDDEFDD